MLSLREAYVRMLSADRVVVINPINNSPVGRPIGTARVWRGWAELSIAVSKPRVGDEASAVSRSMFSST